MEQGFTIAGKLDIAPYMAEQVEPGFPFDVFHIEKEPLDKKQGEWHTKGAILPVLFFCQINQ